MKNRYKINKSNSFIRSLKLMVKRHKDLNKLEKAVDILASGEKLPFKYRDHSLTGKFSGLRECHIEPNWLLIYSVDGDKLILHLVLTGTHSDLFN